MPARPPKLHADPDRDAQRVSDEELAAIARQLRSLGAVPPEASAPPPAPPRSADAPDRAAQARRASMARFLIGPMLPVLVIALAAAVGSLL